MQKLFPKWVRRLDLPTPLVLSVSIPATILLLVLIVLLIVEICTFVIAFADHTSVSTAIATLIASLTTVFAVALAVIAGYIAKGQLKATQGQLETASDQLKAAKEELETGQRIARGDLLLRLDEALSRYDEVREKLASEGEWHTKIGDPSDPKGPDFSKSKDLTSVASYMGVFERIKELVDMCVIDIETVDRLYSSRFFNIVRNKIIYQKRLVAHTTDWQDFIELWKAIVEVRQASIPKRKMPEGVPPPGMPTLDDLLSKLSQS